MPAAVTARTTERGSLDYQRVQILVAGSSAKRLGRPASFSSNDGDLRLSTFLRSSYGSRTSSARKFDFFIFFWVILERNSESVFLCFDESGLVS